MTNRTVMAGLSALCMLGGCGPFPDARAPAVDLRPPQVESVEAVDPTHMQVRFDEDATLLAQRTRISPALAIAGVRSDGRLTIITGEAQVPGRPYVLETEALDARGNSSSFMAEFFGFNGNVPALLINELTPRGSSTHPDLTELAVLSDGNMGGVVLYNGTPGSYESRLIFPALAVRKGSFLVVHWKPAGMPGEVDETGDPSSSFGLDVCSTAWDFWVRGSTGLGGNNGVLALYERSGGSCIDAVLYSNRTSESDARYRGFGSAEMLSRAEEAVRDGAWKAAGARVTPEDAVSPEGSTGTRSLCRRADGADTDTAADWHVVPTSKASFGKANSDEVFAP